MASLKKTSIQDYLGQTACRNLHALHLMSEPRFQLPPPPSFTFSRTKIEAELNWYLENATIPSAAKPDTLALCTVLSITPSDHGL
jgi:hypothetical protein